MTDRAKALGIDISTLRDRIISLRLIETCHEVKPLPSKPNEAGLYHLNQLRQMFHEWVREYLTIVENQIRRTLKSAGFTERDCRDMFSLTPRFEPSSGDNAAKLQLFAALEELGYEMSGKSRREDKPDLSSTTLERLIVEFAPQTPELMGFNVYAGASLLRLNLSQIQLLQGVVSTTLQSFKAGSNWATMGNVDIQIQDSLANFLGDEFPALLVFLGSPFMRQCMPELAKLLSVCRDTFTNIHTLLLAQQQHLRQLEMEKNAIARRVEEDKRNACLKRSQLLALALDGITTPDGVPMYDWLQTQDPESYLPYAGLASSTSQVETVNV